MQVANTDLTVLILGESGVGKESFSKIIHQLSARRHKSFLAVNCGSIPEGTINSELFGHEKGAFTGATDSRKGYFEEADGGTLFLDEIGDTPLETQVRLLRILENGEFIRVGSNKVQKTDVRIVAATNVDLWQKVEQGKFREDLYFRLSAFPINIPPLRERGLDIDLLFRKFTSDFSERNHISPLILTEEARDQLLRYRFPGNIRELKNLAERMSVLETQRTIHEETIIKYLPKNSERSLPAVLPNHTNRTSGGGQDYSERDLLYKIFFDMRKDVVELTKNVDDLKKLVMSLLKGDQQMASQIIEDNQSLFHEYPEVPFKPDRALPAAMNSNSNQHEEERSSMETLELDKYEEITDESQESFSLQKQEEEMIIRALRKNNNKRKYAAQDLGISERTLYRKIKYYGLEDL